LGADFIEGIMSRHLKKDDDTKDKKDTGAKPVEGGGVPVDAAGAQG